MLRLLRWGRDSRPTESGVYCVFLFPDSTDSRWLVRTPTPGTRVRSGSGAVWVVDEVLQSGRDTFTVFCVPRREYRDARRHRSDDRRDLAGELLEAARHASEATTERRHRRKFRRFRP
jgi:hypothetical protein